MMCAFRVTTKTRPSATATPRLTLPQHSDTSYGMACLYCHSSEPVRASSANTQPSHAETYMTPSTTSGDASNEYSEVLECNPVEPSWNTQAGASFLTLPRLIWSIGL